MSKDLIKLTKRELEGKKLAKLREQGIVPSVVYGSGNEAKSTQSSLAETLKVVKHVGKHTPLDVELDGKKHLAIIKDIDFDPVKHTLRHIAFHTISQNEKIVTGVPIRLVGVGESPAERAGLVVLQAIESIEIRALPADLPESLEVNLDKLLTEEDKILISDIILPNGVEYADHEQDINLVVANVYEPSALQAANEASAGEATAEDAANVESEQGAVEEEAKEDTEK